jgi:hypothetical protein
VSIHFPFISPVTGVTFYSDALAKVKEGMVAELYHDKANEFDSNAVAVKVSGNQVGFLPKELARRVVQSGGEFWSGVIVNVLKSHNGIGLRLSVDHQSEPLQNEVLLENIEPKSIIDTLVELVDVKAKSGRLLGTLISKDSTHTKVLTPQGREVLYPNGLLQLN